MSTIAQSQPKFRKEMTDRTGLSEEEARKRRHRGLGNSVRVHAGRSYVEILRKHVFTFINTVLFGIVTALALMDRLDDALTTLSLVAFNVIIGVFQEVRAKRKLAHIALLARPQANVMRDGEEREIDPAEIVQGDLLIARVGDQIAVDGVMIDGTSVEVDESLLTGESEPVAKEHGDEVLSGSLCMTGTLVYEAQKVGANSFVNALTIQAKRAATTRTPMQKEVDFLIRLMLIVVVPLGLLISMSLIVHDTPVVEGMRIAAVVVALLPQGLFFMTTVSYGMGVVRVSGRNALVQQINAIESISHVNVLCMDKTGTLTTNRIQLDAVLPPGSGQDFNEPNVRRVLGDYAATSQDRNRTLDAIRNACHGSHRELLEQVPFTSENKWSALRWDDTSYVLGAPEMLLPFIDGNSDLSAQTEEIVMSGARVLLFAEYSTQSLPRNENGNVQIVPGLKPLAVLVLTEELRDDALEFIEHFRELGIQPKILSGDHPETVAALCRQVGLDGDVRVMSGLDLDENDPASLDDAAKNVTIFGRITPSQKEKLVAAIQRNGGYVAMIGDGVNDVLALKQAEVGVAMQSGSQATRAVADIVLLGDSYSALPAAFREGQRIIKGMEDVVRLLLVRSFYTVLAIVFTQIIGLDFPITPKHNALIALLTVGIPIVAIAAWARPGTPDVSLVRTALRFVYSPAITISLLVIGIYFFYIETTDDLDIARTALTTTAVLCGAALIPFVEPPTRWWVAGDVLSGDWRPTALAGVMLLALVGVFAVAPLRDFAELVVLDWEDFAAISGIVLAWIVVQRQLWRKDLFRKLVRVQT